VQHGHLKEEKALDFHQEKREGIESWKRGIESKKTLCGYI
jgi:hypothetical protein